MYKYYDLVLWSKTAVEWLAIKMQLTGLSSHPYFRFALVLDRYDGSVFVPCNQRSDISAQRLSHGQKRYLVIHTVLYMLFF